MLLFIALASSHYFLQGSSVVGGYPQDGLLALLFFVLTALPGGGSSTISGDPPDLAMLPPEGPP